MGEITATAALLAGVLTAGAAQPQMQLLRIDGGGHTYPGKHIELPWLLKALVGDANRDVDNVDEVWSFFRTKRAAAAHQ